jgi:hypothetical protein
VLEINVTFDKDRLKSLLDALAQGKAIEPTSQWNRDELLMLAGACGGLLFRECARELGATHRDSPHETREAVSYELQRLILWAIKHHTYLASMILVGRDNPAYRNTQPLRLTSHGEQQRVYLDDRGKVSTGDRP